MSTEKKNIVSVLADIQQNLRAPKDLRNNFGGYNYRSAESILEAVKPLLGKHGAVLTISDELVNLGDRYYVKATATIRVGDESTFTTAFAREELDKRGMDASQITGAASSYARKYALNGLLSIDDTKDSDATNTHGKDNVSTTPNRPTQAAKPTPAAPKADESTPIPEKKESPAEAPKKASTKKVETPKLDPKASALDEKGNIKANDAFVEELMDERQAKALKFFKEFDGVNWVKVKAFSKISLKDDPEAAKVAFGCADAKELITKVSVDNCLLIARALTEAAKKGKEEK